MKTYTRTFEGQNEILTFKNSFKIIVNFLGFEVKVFIGINLLKLTNFENQSFTLTDLDNLIIAVDKLSSY